MGNGLAVNEVNFFIKGAHLCLNAFRLFAQIIFNMEFFKNTCNKSSHLWVSAVAGIFRGHQDGLRCKHCDLAGQPEKTIIVFSGCLLTNKKTVGAWLPIYIDVNNRLTKV